MQNRIEELIKICTERVPYYPAGNDGHPEYSIEFNKQKFAELLIKECIKTVKNVQPGYKDYRSQIEEAMQDDCVEAIKQYFEIKE